MKKKETVAEEKGRHIELNERLQDQLVELWLEACRPNANEAQMLLKVFRLGFDEGWRSAMKEKAGE